MKRKWCTNLNPFNIETDKKIIGIEVERIFTNNFMRLVKSKNKTIYTSTHLKFIFTYFSKHLSLIARKCCCFVVFLYNLRQHVESTVTDLQLSHFLSTFFFFFFSVFFFFFFLVVLLFLLPFIYYCCELFCNRKEKLPTNHLKRKKKNEKMEKFKQSWA